MTCGRVCMGGGLGGLPGLSLATSSHAVRSRPHALRPLHRVCRWRCWCWRGLGGGCPLAWPQRPLLARLIAPARAGGSPGGRNVYRLGAVAAQLARGRDGAAPRAATRTA